MHEVSASRTGRSHPAVECHGPPRRPDGSMAIHAQGSWILVPRPILPWMRCAAFALLQALHRGWSAGRCSATVCKQAKKGSGGTHTEAAVSPD